MIQNFFFCWAGGYYTVNPRLGTLCPAPCSLHLKSGIPSPSLQERKKAKEAEVVNIGISESRHVTRKVRSKGSRPRIGYLMFKV